MSAHRRMRRISSKHISYLCHWDSRIRLGGSRCICVYWMCECPKQTAGCMSMNLSTRIIIIVHMRPRANAPKCRLSDGVMVRCVCVTCEWVSEWVKHISTPCHNNNVDVYMLCMWQRTNDEYIHANRETHNWRASFRMKWNKGTNKHRHEAKE